MSQNLTMSPDLGTEDWDPDVITRMIFIGPGAHVSEQEIVTAFHMLDLPLTIKNTCYGSMISGKSEDVYEAIKEIRFSQRKEDLLRVTLDVAGVIDSVLGKVSTKWKKSTEYLVLLLTL